MRNALLYFSGFLVLLVLQEFALSGINLSQYVVVYIYSMLVVMLPLQIKPVPLILVSTLFGSFADLYSGTFPLTTMAMVWVAYLRPFIVKLTLPAEIIVAAGVPFARRIGVKYFLRYAFVVSFLYVAFYCMMEVMSFENFLMTIVRIVSGSVLTTALVYLLQLPLKSK